MTADPAGAVDRLFRRNAGQVVAALVRAFGAERLDLAEDAVQDALVRALEVWRFQGVPANPGGWVYRVAYHRALDLLRREGTLRDKLAGRPPVDGADPPALALDGPLADDELALVFLCCHPALSPDSRVALTLRVACGFGVPAIGQALLAEPSAVAQRIVRAKRTLRDREVALDLPGETEVLARLDSVLECLYLLFSEGYNAHDGDPAVRVELCHEAIRLGALLAAHPLTARPRVHALLALMYFQASRLGARCRDGALVLLEAQDTTGWDARLIAAGMTHLDRAAAGDTLTGYHVEAAIAAAFASGAPDWHAILGWYDQLFAIAPSPVVRLNRAVAVGKVRGPRAALDELLPLRDVPAMRRYYLFPALLGVYYAESGRTEDAVEAYRAALRLGGNAAERRLIASRLEALQAVSEPLPQRAGGTAVSSAPPAAR